MTDTINHDTFLDQEAQGLVLVEMVEIQPAKHEEPGVGNSGRIDRLEACFLTDYQPRSQVSFMQKAS
jgi:hypothetical protein